MRSILLCLVFAIFAVPLKAEDLLQVYTLALEQDTGLQLAQQNYKISQAGATISRSGLYPQLRASANASRDYEPSSSESRGYSINFSQTIFDLNRWFNYQSGKVRDEQAKLTLSSAQQDLIIRTVDRYFAVLAAQASLDSALGSEEAAKLQFERAQRRFDVGDTAATDVNSAQANFDNQRVNRLIAENNLQRVRENLAVMTGSSLGILASLSDEFQIKPPLPADVESWVNMAKSGNFEFRNRLLNLEIANNNLKANKWENIPTISVSGGYSYNRFDSPGFLASGGDFSIGVTASVSLPLYVGGSRKASREIARANRQISEISIDSAERDLVRRIRTDFSSLNTDVVRIATLRDAISTAERNLKSTEIGIENGSRNVLDLLNAQNALFSAQLRYTNARYIYITDMLRLKQQTGSLSPQDIIDLNRWLDK